MTTNETTEDRKPTAAEAAATGPASAPAGDATPVDVTRVEAEVVDALRTVYDPEIPVNIYEIGLIYEVRVREDGFVHILMTLTSPMCPAAQSLPMETEYAARSVEGVTDVKVDVVWDPPWGPDKMTEAAKLQLGLI